MLIYLSSSKSSKSALALDAITKFVFSTILLMLAIKSNIFTLFDLTMTADRWNVGNFNLISNPKSSIFPVDVNLVQIQLFATERHEETCIPNSEDLGPRMACDLAWKSTNYNPGVLEKLREAQSVVRELDQILGDDIDAQLVIHANLPEKEALQPGSSVIIPFRSRTLMWLLFAVSALLEGSILSLSGSLIHAKVVTSRFSAPPHKPYHMHSGALPRSIAT